ncbi:MAG: hypothetical protein DDT36_01753 [Firmicutes bacterium]|nr:hypothetical protein [Bacillota bacterium]
MNCLERLLPGDTAADIKEELAYGEAQRYFDQSGVGHFSSQSKGLCPRVGGGTKAVKPIYSIQYDAGYMGQGLDIIDDCRLTP